MQTQLLFCFRESSCLPNMKRAQNHELKITDVAAGKCAKQFKTSRLAHVVCINIAQKNRVFEHVSQTFL